MSNRVISSKQQNRLLSISAVQVQGLLCVINRCTVVISPLSHVPKKCPTYLVASETTVTTCRHVSEHIMMS